LHRLTGLGERPQGGYDVNCRSKSSRKVAFAPAGKFVNCASIAKGVFIDMGKVNISASRLKRAGLYSTALTAFTLIGSAALAQTAPAAGSLPGNFTATGAAGTTYTLDSNSTKSATIAIGTASGPVALDFNSAAGNVKLTPSSGSALPAGVTQNAGLSLGAGASVAVDASGASALLLNDSSGNPSQIYGQLNVSGSTGPVFVANAAGIVVGPTGSIAVPGNLGLVGYAQSDAAFAGSGGTGLINVDSSVKGSGAVTIMNGTTLAPSGSPATVLVAGNGAINIGAAAQSGTYQVVAGEAFSSDGTTISPPSGASSPTPLTGNAAAVTLSGGTTASQITVSALYAAGSVTNNGVATLQDAGTGYMKGAFVNNGNVTLSGSGSSSLQAGSITNNGVITDTPPGGGMFQANGIGTATSGADIVNTGKINESGTGLAFNAGSSASGSATGNFTNNGTIAFTTYSSSTSPSLVVSAENIQFNGSVMATPSGGSGTPPAALSSSNALSSFVLDAGYYSGGAPAGVVDYNSTVYANQIILVGQADRILGGGLYGAGSDSFAGIGYGSGSAADPFTKSTLAYNFSVFKGATVQADYVGLVGLDANGYADVGTLNLNGTVGVLPSAGSSSGVTAYAQTINGTGGFVLNDGNYLELFFSGNVNNPNGAASVGSTNFLYNYLPVTVATTSSGAPGTANVVLSPSLTGGAPQFVNLMVKGNVAISGVPYNPATGTTSAPFSVSTATNVVVAQPSAQNNHLVLQATGNIYTDGWYTPGQAIEEEGSAVDVGPEQMDGGMENGFYWPGVMRLATVASASTPDMLSATNGITLENDLNNTLPIASTGGTGIFLKTNNLNLNGNNVVTNAKSWVNFATPQMASAYATTLASSFWQVTPTSYNPNLLTLQQLPASAFQAAP
jgi:filamentous hemagglutinin family protein